MDCLRANESKCYVLSGGLATEIERRGVKLMSDVPGFHSERDQLMFDGGKFLMSNIFLVCKSLHEKGDPLWSARTVAVNPNLILDIHKSFLLHGADIITTASYQASVDGYQKHLGVSASEALDLIGKSVTIAKEAKEWFMAQPQYKGRMTPLIGGSVGPYGACLYDGSEYTGIYMNTVSEQVIREWHRPRIAKLLEAGVDFLAVETIPSLKEAECILDVLKEFPTGRAWVAFSCKDEIHTCYGDVFSSAISRITSNDYSSQVVAVGINCTPPQYVVPLLKGCSSSKPLVVYPNTGEDWIPGVGNCGERTYRPSIMQQSFEHGARIIGGCCRVTPEDIYTLRTLFQEHTVAQN